MRPVAPQAAPGLSAIFANCNRNKRSVALDLKTEAGKAALHEADPDGRRLRPQHAPGGDGQARLHLQGRARRQPKIVYAAAIGFGRHGRYAGKPAYDDVIQAASGFAGLFQMRDGRAALRADHRRRQGLGPAPGLRGAGRPAVPRAHRRGTRLRRGADVRADGGVQPVRAPERTPPSRRTARSATSASSRRAGGHTRPRTAGSPYCHIPSATGSRC